MAKTLKISDAASLGLHAMVFLAGSAGRAVATGRIAGALGASSAHLSKVLQRLTKEGLLLPARGPKGGFTLAKPPSKVTLLAVYESIDGPLAASGCLFGAPVCGRKGCIMGGLLRKASEDLRKYLARTKLSDLVEEDARWLAEK